LHEITLYPAINSHFCFATFVAANITSEAASTRTVRQLLMWIMLQVGCRRHGQDVYHLNADVSTSSCGCSSCGADCWI